MAETQNPICPMDDNAKKIMIDFYKEALNDFLGPVGPDCLVPYVRHAPFYLIAKCSITTPPAAEEGASAGSRLAGRGFQ